MTFIEEKFNSLLFGGVNLGLAMGEEEPTSDGGAKQRFQFGTIYFHPRVGEAFECHGAILERYIEMGEERGDLGYPMTDEIIDPAVPGGRLNEFERGRLVWDASSGVSLQFDDDVPPLPQVVVKLQDQIPLHLGQGETLSMDELETLVGGLFPGFAGAFFPGLGCRRLFDSLSPEEIQSLVEEAKAARPDYEPPNFENYLAIDCPAGFDASGLVFTLQQAGGAVEFAYIVPEKSVPGVVGTSNTFFSKQTHLGGHAGKVGINVQAAWGFGADGTGTRFIDLEQGWELSHVDLPFGIPKLDGIINKKTKSHGTGVLGIIVGVDNNQGIVGIAPGADASVISHYHPRDRTADMIMEASKLLRPGDVLLLEIESGVMIQGAKSYIPVEAPEPAVFAAIELATSRGVIVVEAAGNSGVDLDSLFDEGSPILPRDPLHDSGAILVGACHADLPYRRWSTPVTIGTSFGSNLGSRIDCAANGEFIVTAGSRRNGADPTLYSTGPHYYMDFFGGTSGASAIIAGVCLLIQGLQSKLVPKSGIVGPLWSHQMRALLSDPQNGISSSDSIGVMPDLRKIIDHEYEFPIL